MSKDKFNVDLKVSNDEEGEVRITISDEKKDLIPRPGESIFVVEPYPVDDEDVVTGSERLKDIKERPIMGYSFTGLMAKAVVLSDDLETVTINGDFQIPLVKKFTESPRKQMIFTKEVDARDTYRTLMNASIKEAARRLKKAEDIKEYLETALEKMHH